MTKRGNVKLVYNNIPKVTPAVEARADKVVRATAFEIDRHIKAGMRGPKTGRSYRRGSIKRTGKALAGMGLRTVTTASGKKYYIVGAKLHRASAPGESPAIDTGAYANSWFVRTLGKMRAIVGTNAEQGRALEYGAPRRNLLPRPHLRPAVDASRDTFIQRMRAIFK